MADRIEDFLRVGEGADDGEVESGEEVIVEDWMKTGGCEVDAAESGIKRE